MTTHNADHQRRSLRVATIAFVALCVAGFLAATPATAGATRSASHHVKPRWGSAITIDRRDHTPGGVTAISCPTSTFCAAVDGSGHAMLFHGTAWTKPEKLDTDPYGFTSVSCPSSHRCIAADTQGDIDTYNGSRWSGLHQIDPDSNVDVDQMAVSCPTASFCAAVDTDGNELVLRDGSWTSHAAGSDLYSVSCATDLFCVAGSEDGTATVWDGTSWAAPSTIDTDGQAVIAVSCSSASFCAAGGSTVVIWNGQHWVSQQSISPALIESIECTGSRFCLAGDALIGNIYRWNGTRWLPSTTFHDAESVNSIACPSRSFCIAVGDARQAHVYAVAPAIRTHAVVARMGHHFRLRLKADGGRPAYRWAKTGGRLPPGLSLSHQGVISGTPTKAGSFRFTVRVRDAVGESTSRAIHATVKH